MADGLAIWSEDGRLLFGPTTSNVTVLGIVNTGKSNGSINNPALSIGMPVVVQALASEGDITSFYMPRIQFSGSTLSWSFEVSGANYNVPARIIYGVRA